MSDSDLMSPLLCLKVWGDAALFTRPEMKVERVTYDIMTPSAARGILEAILWKPQMRWVVERIHVLNPIRKDRIRRNEVENVASVANAAKALNGHAVSLGIDIEHARQQRAALVLKDVAYLLCARIALTNKAGPEDSLTKYSEIFRRRASKGQCFHRPYLGTREFACEFELIEGDPPPAIPEDKALGWMLYDIDHSGPTPEPLFFEAHLIQGCLSVPAPDSPEVAR